MNTLTSEGILPVEETVDHKTDVLNWTGLSLEGCDFEYRVDFRLGGAATLEVVLQLLTQLSLVSLAAWVLARPIAMWVAPRLDSPLAAILSIVVGVAWAVLAESTLCTRTEEEDAPLIQPATVGCALLPLLLCQAITFTRQLDLLAGAFLYYLLVSLPLVTVMFDLFATHAVHWITASSASDYAAMTLGRHAWARRLFGSSDQLARNIYEPDDLSDCAVERALQTVGVYRWGGLWIAVATLAPPTVVAITCGDAKPTTLGLLLVAGTTFGLLAAVILRSGGDLRIVPRFFRMLVHWFYYGWKDRLPPWVHHSPCGGWLQRQWCALVAVGLLSVPLTSMASHSFIGLFESAATHSTIAHVDQPSDDENADHLSMHSIGSTVAASPWLWVAPTLLVAFTVPATNFCLIGMLLTGNVISAYSDAFEASLGVPPRPIFPAEEEEHSALTGEGDLS